MAKDELVGRKIPEILVDGNVKRPPLDWSEVTFGRWIEYVTKIEPIVEALMEEGVENEQGEKVLSVEEVLRRSEGNVDKIGKVCKFVAYWWDISVNDAYALRLVDLSVCYVYMIGLLYGQVNFDLEEDKFIIHDGETYFFPETLPLVGGQMDIMATETVGNYINSLQYHQYFKNASEGDVAAIPYLSAFLVRKQGETIPLEEVERRQWIDRRVAVFKGMHMANGWKVMGFFLRRLITLQSGFRIYTQKRKSKEKRRRK